MLENTLQDESKDLSSCLTDIYNSMSLDSGGSNTARSSDASDSGSINLSDSTQKLPTMISTAPKSSFGVPNNIRQPAVLIRSNSETYMSQQHQQQQQQQQQQYQMSPDTDSSQPTTPPNEKNGGKNANWSAAAIPSNKARSDSVAVNPTLAKDSSFLRFNGATAAPPVVPPRSSTSYTPSPLASSSPVFTAPQASSIGSSPVSLTNSASSLNMYSSSPPLSSSPLEAGMSASELMKRRQHPPQPLPPIPNDRRSKTSPFPSNTPAPMASLMRTASTAPKPISLPRPSTPICHSPTLSSDSLDDLVEEPENLDDPNLVLVKNDAGQLLVKGGTLERLVSRLSYDKQHDTDFASAFLLTYRTFTTPLELLDMLIASYNVSGDDAIAAATFEKKKKIVRLRVANVLKMWLDKHFHDFQEDAALVGKLDLFINEQIIVDLEGIGRNLKKLLYNERNAPIPVFNEAPPASIVPKSRDPAFLDLDTTEVARQLTLIESDLYRRIESKECLGQAWNKNDKEDRAANIVAFIRRFNAVSIWVATEVVRAEKLKDRVTVVKRFILIAQKCRDMGNFNGCMEILSGLQNSSVFRLSKTWEKIESKPLLKNMYDEMILLMSNKNNFKDYRAALHSVHPPCIPYLGVYLTDLTFIEDATKNTLNNRDDLINFEKRRRISVVIREIKQYQQTPYHLLVEENTARYIRALPSLTEKAFYLIAVCAVVMFADNNALQLLQTFNIGLFIVSKIPQILTVHQLKNVGQLSFFTSILNLGGSFARIFTTLKEIDNPAVLASYLIGAFLNFVIVVQFLMYWNNKIPTRKVVPPGNKKKVQ
eukprot:gene17494-20872_t